MHITNIRINGFGELRDFERPLSQIQLICGENGTGKTAILDAVAIGLIGYCPALGNKPIFTKGRMSGAIGNIRLSMTGGTCEVTLPRTGSPNVKKTGEMPTMDPMVIDISKFFGMTGPQRVRFLLGISRVEVPTVEAVRDAMYADTYDKHQLGREEWLKKTEVIFSKFTGPQESLDWLTNLAAECLNQKNVAAGLPALRETLLRLEVEASTENGALADRSVDLAKNRIEQAALRKQKDEISAYANSAKGQLANLKAQAEKFSKLSLDVPDKKCPTCGGTVKGVQKEASVKEAHLKASRAAEEAMVPIQEKLAGYEAAIAKTAGELDVLTMQESGLRAQQDAFLARAGKVLQIDKLRLQIMETEENVLLFQPLPHWVTTYQASLLDTSMQHVCQTASQIVQKRFNGSVGIREGNFVYIKPNGTEIGLEFASGGQRLLATVGIQVALMQASPFKVVLVDELGRVDDKSLEVLYEVIGELVAAGQVDQFIGARPSINPDSLWAREVIAL